MGDQMDWNVDWSDDGRRYGACPYCHRWIFGLWDDETEEDRYLDHNMDHHLTWDCTQVSRDEHGERTYDEDGN